MRGDGYRPPDLIPPVLRARFYWLLEILVTLGAAAGFVAGVITLFR